MNVSISFDNAQYKELVNFSISLFIVQGSCQIQHSNVHVKGSHCELRHLFIVKGRL